MVGKDMAGAGMQMFELSTAASREISKKNYAKKPMGASCLDFEVYVVRKNAPVKLLSSTPTNFKLQSIFPTTSAFFGPYHARVAGTPALLFHEYGKQCLQVYKYKAVKGRTATWHKVADHNCKRVWPSKRLLRDEHLFALVEQ